MHEHSPAGQTHQQSQYRKQVVDRAVSEPTSAIRQLAANHDPPRLPYYAVSSKCSGGGVRIRIALEKVLFFPVYHCSSLSYSPHPTSSKCTAYYYSGRSVF